jgi:hypothetical protein
MPICAACQLLAYICKVRTQADAHMFQHSLTNHNVSREIVKIADWGIHASHRARLVVAATRITRLQRGLDGHHKPGREKEAAEQAESKSSQ